MAEHQMVNGIDVTALKETIEAMREDASVGDFRFRANHRWVDGTHFITTIQDFHRSGHEDRSRPGPFVFDADEPPVLLGTDFGPNATEAALHALASCLSATFMFQAAYHGIEIDQLHIEIEGNLDLRGFLGLSEDVRNGYELINVTFYVGTDASEEKVQELAELAQKRSPVFDIVTHETPVSVKSQKIREVHKKRETAHI